MSPAVWTTLLGMAALLVGQRLAGGEGALGNGATALGALLIFSGAALRARMISASVGSARRASNVSPCRSLRSGRSSGSPRRRR